MKQILSLMEYLFVSLTKMTSFSEIRQYFQFKSRPVLFFCIIQACIVSAAFGQSSFKINFSDPNTTAPSGWLRDIGEPYGLRNNGQTYGWVDPINRNPVDISNRGRNRNPNPDADIFRETLMHMRFSDVSSTAQDGDWEMAIPNGTYRITVQVGDANSEDNFGVRHLISAEGVQVVDFPVANGVFGVKNGSAVVTVSDGLLSLNATNSNNAKIHFVIIEPTNGLETPVILGTTPADGGQNAFLNQPIVVNDILIA